MDINANDNSLWDDIYEAISNDNDQSLKTLIQTGTNINQTGPGGLTPLIISATRGNEKCLKLLIKHGASVNAKTDIGWSALHHTAYTGQDKCVQILINHKAAVNTQDLDGKTPLHRAAISGHVTIIKRLIHSKAEVNAPAFNGKMALHYAAENGHCACVDKLIRKGAKVNAQTAPKGKSALHLASQKGHMDCLQSLLKHGSDPTLSDIKGSTALHDAAKYGNEACIAILVNNGACVNAQNNSGWTPLHMAVASGHRKCVDELLRYSVDTSVTTSNNETVFDLAKRLGRGDLCTKNIQDCEMQSRIEHANQTGRGDTSMTEFDLAERLGRNGNSSMCGENIIFRDDRLRSRIEQADTDLKTAVTPETSHRPSPIQSRDRSLQSKKKRSCTKCECNDCQNKPIANKAQLEQLSSMVNGLRWKYEGIEERIESKGTDKGAIFAFNVDDGMRYVMVGKDYMDQRTKSIFTMDNALYFRDNLDHVYDVIAHMYQEDAITCAHVQTLNSQANDIRRAKYLWDLMLKGPQYLEAVRNALVFTKQRDLADRLTTSEKLDV